MDLTVRLIDTKQEMDTKGIYRIHTSYRPDHQAENVQRVFLLSLQINHPHDRYFIFVTPSFMPNVPLSKTDLFLVIHNDQITANQMRCLNLLRLLPLARM